MSRVFFCILDLVGLRTRPRRQKSCFARSHLRIRASQELVLQPIELQWVVDFDLGSSGSPSWPVLGWQPCFSTGGSEIRPYPPPESNRHSNHGTAGIGERWLGNPLAGILF